MTIHWRNLAHNHQFFPLQIPKNPIGARGVLASLCFFSPVSFYLFSPSDLFLSLSQLPQPAKPHNLENIIQKALITIFILLYRREIMPQALAEL